MSPDAPVQDWTRMMQRHQSAHFRRDVMRVVCRFAFAFWAFLALIILCGWRP